MKKITILGLILSLFVSTFAIANEVNIFNARHYKADAELYDKFTAATGIKVNLINGKSGALEKRMIEEGSDSAADLYITADAGRCGAFQAKGMTQSGLTSFATEIPIHIANKIVIIVIFLIFSPFSLMWMVTISNDNDYQSHLMTQAY